MIDRLPGGIWQTACLPLSNYHSTVTSMWNKFWDKTLMQFLHIKKMLTTCTFTWLTGCRVEYYKLNVYLCPNITSYPVVEQILRHDTFCKFCALKKCSQLALAHDWRGIWQGACLPLSEYQQLPRCGTRRFVQVLHIRKKCAQLPLLADTFWTEYMRSCSR